jgi:hypothetical protein
MQTGWKILLLAGLAANWGCGKSPAKSADSSSGEKLPTVEEQCVHDAAIAREPSNPPTSIVVSHILVRHADLERPMGAQRTRQQACRRALEALHALKGGSMSWAEAVQKYSDAPGPNDGSLGQVTKETLDPAFWAAAFSLDVNELSYVVESKRGYHVILRTE